LENDRPTRAQVLLAIKQLRRYLAAMHADPASTDKPANLKPLSVVEMGRRGGNARAKRLSPRRRKAIARRAARARWSKKKTA
jgi:hypothetical protein